MSAIIAARARAVAIPAGLWLTAIVVCSIVVRVALGHRMVAPWIMVDELVYSELAKNVAAHGEFLVRGVPSHGYGFVYPVLISPAWKLFTSIPDAYAAAKAIDAVLMSLAAIPAYFLARRVLPARPLAGLGAARRPHPLDALHGDADDGERVLPAVPARGVPARPHARGADRLPSDRAARRLRDRVRDARPGGRALRRRGNRADPARPDRAPRSPRDSAPLRLALRPARRRRGARARRNGRAPAARPCRSSAPTEPPPRARTRSAASSTSSSTTSQSSTSTSASSRSPRSSPSGSRLAVRAPAPVRSPRRRSRSGSGCSPRSPPSRRRAS